VTTPAEALRAIREALPALGSERVPVARAAGRALRQSVVAERDQPPFDRVMMDGIAIRHDDFERGTRAFPIVSTQAAGDAQQTLERGGCIEIMTGASLPRGADCIVPVERIGITGGVATIEEGYETRRGQFIHGRGSDHECGAELLRPGGRISPLDIAVLLACGLTEVEVSSLPALRVISTGNELVPAGAPIEAHQIRLTNGPAVIAMLAAHGYHDAAHEHLADDPDLLETRLAAHLDAADVLVLSGGVSMGKADFVPQVLERLGVSAAFHGIRQRPGRPMWFGTGPRGQAVFALPGNPVSTLVCCREYLIPALDSASGLLSARPEFASLTEDFSFEPALTCFLPARIVSNVGGQLLAMPAPTNTSGDFTSLATTDGYVELAADRTRFPAGTAVRLTRW
jgi:molybdopterin molybdotransferase